MVDRTRSATSGFDPLGAGGTPSVITSPASESVRGLPSTGTPFRSGERDPGELFAQACRHAGVTQSMGRTGSALDNAASESFNSTVEFELLRSTNFTTKQQARRAVAGWIDGYNTVRRHSTDQMLSPVDYEHRHATTERAAA